jgi:hypothetical protein
MAAKKKVCAKAQRKEAIKTVKKHYKTAPTKAGRAKNWAKAMKEHYRCKPGKRSSKRKRVNKS